MENLKNIAVFIDYENFSDKKFDIAILLDKLKERGRLIIKKADADWERFKRIKHEMLENSVELIELPTHANSKNFADIKLVVDALETAITKDYIDTFVVVSGDSDYTPLISKLREHDKYVIVVSGEKGQTSKLLPGYCDELIYYNNMTDDAVVESTLDIHQAFELLVRTINHLNDNGEETRGSRIKQYMKQLDASFDEMNYGFKQFKRFLVKASEDGFVTLKLLEKGDYHVKLFENKATKIDDSEIKVEVAETKPSVELSKGKTITDELINNIVWAYQLNSEGNNSEVAVSLIAKDLKEVLMTEFKLQTYGYSRTEGFIGLLKDMQKQGSVKLIFNSDKNQYYMQTMPGLEENIQLLPKPPQFFQLYLRRRTETLNVNTNLTHIYVVSRELETFLNKQNSTKNSNTGGMYTSFVRNFKIAGMTIPLRRTINTLLQANVMFDSTNNVVNDFKLFDSVTRIIPLQDVIEVTVHFLISTYQQLFSGELLDFAFNYLNEQIIELEDNL